MDILTLLISVMTSGNRKCRGWCTNPLWEHKDKITVDKRQPYIRGYKRCGACEIYLDNGLINCPCCLRTLKSKPRNVDSKRKYNDTVLQVVGY